MNQKKNKMCLAVGLTAVYLMTSGLFVLGFAADSGSGIAGTKSDGRGARHHQDDHLHSPFAHVLKFKEKLALTADQIEKIKAKEFEYIHMDIENQAAREIAHLQLHRLVHSGKVDEARMREIADHVSAIKSAKLHAMVEGNMFILKLLTPEQRQKISQVHGVH